MSSGPYSSSISSSITFSWRLTVSKMLAKYKDDLLAGKRKPMDFVNVDREVHPQILRNDVDVSEKRVVVIGKVPYRNTGLKVDIQGDRNRTSSRYLQPMKDGEVVRDVISLGNITGDYKILSDIWKQQMRVIERIDTEAEVRIDGTPLMEAPVKFHGLAKSDVAGREPRDKIEIIWEKFETVGQDRKNQVLGDRRSSNVTSGALYLPSVMENGCPPFCLLEDDVIKQHEILDEHGYLIPPWQMSNEVRPGSVVVAVVAIWETNTLCSPPKNGYFERRFELRGRWARVLKRGCGSAHDYAPPPLCDRRLVSCGPALAWQRLLTEYAGYEIKRKTPL